MSIARKLALLTAMALTAMALTATNAAATNPVEVINEDTEELCDFAAGNCQFHATGESHINNSDGTRLTTCEDELEGKLGAGGTGHIAQLENADHAGQACVLQNCTGNPEGAGEGEWPIANTEEIGAHEVTMNMEFCLEHKTFPNLTGNHCNLPVHVSEPVENSHHYVLAIDPAFECPNGRTFEGQWEIETNSTTHDDFEIIH